MKHGFEFHCWKIMQQVAIFNTETETDICLKPAVYH